MERMICQENLFGLGIVPVRLTGLEPAHREILDPKSSASTNSATGAETAMSFLQKEGLVTLFACVDTWIRTKDPHHVKVIL